MEKIRHFARRHLPDVLNPFLPYIIHEAGNGLRRLKELMDEGDGVIVIFNHPSKREPMQIPEFLWTIEGMDKRSIGAPVAYHHSKQLMVQVGTSLLGCQIFPLVTEHTISLGENDGHPINFGLDKYIAGSTTILRDKGIVFMAPQTQRESNLDLKNVKPSISALITLLKMNRINNPTLLFVGVGIDQVENYESVLDSINFRKRYIYNVGNAYRLREFTARVPKGKFKKEWNHNLDITVLNELATLVPEPYLKK